MRPQQAPVSGKVFIQRDYSGGTRCQFQSKFPAELENRVRAAGGGGGVPGPRPPPGGAEAPGEPPAGGGREGARPAAGSMPLGGHGNGRGQRVGGGRCRPSAPRDPSPAQPRVVAAQQKGCVGSSGMAPAVWHCAERLGRRCARTRGPSPGSAFGVMCAEGVSLRVTKQLRLADGFSPAFCVFFSLLLFIVFCVFCTIL